MAKDQSFADKFSKSSHDFNKHCDACGEAITAVKYVTTERSEKTGAVRFNQQFVGVCKCNENDLT